MIGKRWSLSLSLFFFSLVHRRRRGGHEKSILFSFPYSLETHLESTKTSSPEAEFHYPTESISAASGILTLVTTKFYLGKKYHRSATTTFLSPFFFLLPPPLSVHEKFRQLRSKKYPDISTKRCKKKIGRWR